MTDVWPILMAFKTGAWWSGWHDGVAGRPQHPFGQDLQDYADGYREGAARKRLDDADRRGD